MGNQWVLVGSFILILGIVTTSARSLEEYADIMGPYCQKINQCCHGRQDHCAVPILETLCYCDDFCNSTRVDDCCPDYFSYCQGIQMPTSTWRPSTTRRWEPEPEPDMDIAAPLTSCDFNGRRYQPGDIIYNNCNKGECTLSTDQWGEAKAELQFEQNICLLDTRITETVNRENFGWRAGNYSEFWGKTLDEGLQKRLGTHRPSDFVMKMNPVRRYYDPNRLPREFDSLTKWPGMLTEIQDQGWCASSWAMSTAAVASDRFSVISKGLEKVQLSAQNLISCDVRQDACNGGTLDRAWFFIKRVGLVDEDCYPYMERKDQCNIGKHGSLSHAGCSSPSSGRVGRYKVGPAYSLRNETDIMYEITKGGPVQALMKVYHDFFTYKSGVYRHTDLSVLDKTAYHSVRIVGWGEEYSSTGEIQKYWKAANTWGREWGENGYFRISRGSNECEIESFVLATWPAIEKKVLLLNERQQENEIKRYNY